jgi:hypothetical protein
MNLDFFTKTESISENESNREKESKVYGEAEVYGGSCSCGYPLKQIIDPSILTTVLSGGSATDIERDNITSHLYIPGGLVYLPPVFHNINSFIHEEGKEEEEIESIQTIAEDHYNQLLDLVSVPIDIFKKKKIMKNTFMKTTFMNTTNKVIPIKKTKTKTKKNRLSKNKKLM